MVLCGNIILHDLDSLFLFIFQLCEKYYTLSVVIEEINNRDPQTVAQLLQCGDGGAVVASADHIVHSGLRDAADRA